MARKRMDQQLESARERGRQDAQKGRRMPPVGLLPGSPRMKAWQAGYQEVIAKTPKPKRTLKMLTLNGFKGRYEVFEEPQADLYQIHISGVGQVLFTKKELEVASKRSQSLNKKYRFIP